MVWHVAKGFTQNEGIDYIETFFLIFNKDYLHIILILIAYFDLEMQQINVKIAFLNGDLKERFTWNNLNDSPLVMVSIWSASLRNSYTI
jgi:hypothetical protein